MTIEEAIQTAIEFEKRVRDHFQRAADRSEDPKAKEFFKVLAREEEDHVAYLEAKLDQWREQGRILPQEISTVVPNREWIRKGVRKLEATRAPRDYAAASERLHMALKLEQESTEHYRKLVEAVQQPEAKAMFRRFLEIEDGHTAIVQAEIDVVTKTGSFFGFQEFTMDG